MQQRAAGGPDSPTGTHGGVFPGVPPERGRRLGWFWVLCWLVFLVPPVVDHAQGDGRHQTGAALLVLGAGVYVLTMRRAVRAAFLDGLWGGPRHVAWIVAGSGGVLVCLLAAAPLIGQDAFSLLPYAVVIVAMGLPLRLGMIAGLGIALGAYLLCPRLTGETMYTGLLFSALASGTASALGAYSIGRTIVARRAEQDAALLRLQEERNSMARDLHDILGHSLTVITMKAELAARLVDIDPEKARAQIEEVEQLSRSALADVRRAVTGYREISLAGEITRARAALRDKGITADLPGAVDDVAPDLRELFAWTVREATTNVIRHSGATRVTMTLTPTRLRIHDDGRGSTCGAGTGLSGLRERAEAAGATLTTAGDDGFTVVVEARPATTHAPLEATR